MYLFVPLDHAHLFLCDGAWRLVREQVWWVQPNGSAHVIQTCLAPSGGCSLIFLSAALLLLPPSPPFSPFLFCLPFVFLECFCLLAMLCPHQRRRGHLTRRTGGLPGGRHQLRAEKEAERYRLASAEVRLVKRLETHSPACDLLSRVRVVRCRTQWPIFFLTFVPALIVYFVLRPSASIPNHTSAPNANHPSHVTAFFFSSLRWMQLRGCLCASFLLFSFFFFGEVSVCASFGHLVLRLWCARSSLGARWRTAAMDHCALFTSQGTSLHSAPAFLLLHASRSGSWRRSLSHCDFRRGGDGDGVPFLGVPFPTVRARNRFAIDSHSATSINNHNSKLRFQPPLLSSPLLSSPLRSSPLLCVSLRSSLSVRSPPTLWVTR